MNIKEMTEKEKSCLHDLMQDLLDISGAFADEHNLSNTESFEVLKLALLECIRAKIGGIDRTLYERI